MYGGMWKIPVPDIRRTDLLVVMGANPHASQGSLLACPDVMGEIDAIRARGGKVIVVDPRRTGTAERADEWLPIMPGTDAALLLAVAQVLFAEGLVDLGTVGRPASTASTDLRGLVADWTPERVGARDRHRRRAHPGAGPTSSPAPSGRSSTAASARATRSSARWPAGWSTSSTSSPATSTCPAALMFPRPVGLAGHRPADARSRGRGRRTSAAGGPGCGARPRCSATCRCRAWPRRSPRRARARSGRCSPSPATPSCRRPGGDRLDAALAGLDCMISVDNWLNETTRHAHVILPGLSPLEQAHHDDLHLELRGRQRGATTRRRSSRPTDGRPHEWEILIRLAGACLGQPAGEVDVAAIDDGFFDVLADDPGPRRPDAAGAVRRRAVPSGCSTSRCAPARSATATASVPDGPDARQGQGRAARHRPRADGAAPRRGRSPPPSGKVVAGAAVHHRRPAPAGGPARPARRRPGAGQPPAPPVEQLVDAQRQGAREGQGPLHAAHAPRRRRPLPASPTATLATVALRGRARSRCRSR